MSIKAKEYFANKYKPKVESADRSAEAPPEKKEGNTGSALKSWKESMGGKQSTPQEEPKQETKAAQPAPGEEKKEQAGQQAPPEPETPPEEFGEEDYNKWKDKLDEVANDVIDDPEGTAEFILMMIDMARLFICPTMAEQVLFTKQDKATLKDILPEYLKTKIIPLEHVDVIRKYETHVRYRDNLPYTAEQRKMLAKALLRRAKMMKTSHWFYKYDLWIMLIGIELFKMGPVFTARVSAWMSAGKK